MLALATVRVNAFLVSFWYKQSIQF